MKTKKQIVDMSAFPPSVIDELPFDAVLIGEIEVYWDPATNKTYCVEEIPDFEEGNPYAD